MDCITRMKQIRIINKISENPEVSKKLGLKDRSYYKDAVKFQKGDKHYG